MGACHSSENDDGASPSPLEEKIMSRLSSTSSQALSNNSGSELQLRRQHAERKQKAVALVRKQRAEELDLKFQAGLFDEATLRRLKHIEKHRKLMLNVQSSSSSSSSNKLAPTQQLAVEESTQVSANSSPVAQGDDLLLPHVVADISIVASFEASVLKPGEGSHSFNAAASTTSTAVSVVAPTSKVAPSRVNVPPHTTSPSKDLMELPPLGPLDGDDPHAIPDSLNSSDNLPATLTPPLHTLANTHTPMLAASPRSQHKGALKGTLPVKSVESLGLPGRRVRFSLPDQHDSPCQPQFKNTSFGDSPPPPMALPPPLDTSIAPSIGLNGNDAVETPTTKFRRQRSLSGSVLMRDCRRKSFEGLL